ncbi:hypothetical protein N7462_000673 [Penicillium macrosclerotiorum]|uniref:uncharacterized protein n=1 Tax=Penicillium macrosclerotiorum TaxID=303699 RepID=UPI002548CFDC|nr:uncharacterized protein N7462_000673 [Penicillium macrosclerotiorum]KAJ5698668.1 hypothetical protein N7462_000673 [Penicillium macrosclerotiorum]
MNGQVQDIGYDSGVNIGESQGQEETVPWWFPGHGATTLTIPLNSLKNRVSPSLVLNMDPI